MKTVRLLKIKKKKKYMYTYNYMQITQFEQTCTFINYTLFTYDKKYLKSR